MLANEEGLNALSDATSFHLKVDRHITMLFVLFSDHLVVLVKMSRGGSEVSKTTKTYSPTSRSRHQEG